MPNAFIVGVPKSGTTTVFSALSAQPGVCPSQTKEAHFFDPLKFGEPLPPLSEYEALFAPRPEDTVLLEATPGYFHGGAAIAEKIREISPEGRVAIILREPGARAFSWYRFQRTRLKLDQGLSFEEYISKCEALGLEPESTRGEGAWTGLSGGLYATWLPEWQRVFGDDLLVMFSDEFREAPDKALRRIGAHLRIDVAQTETDDKNVSVDISNPRLQKVALKINNAGERLWRRFPGLKRRLMGAYYKLNAKKAQDKRMSPEARERLDRYFADSIDELRMLLPNVPEKWGTR
ncbi:sulfotransferase family protein [Microbacterium karelineae]|uniref:sulfotransferase family protein n=1 Tax=Microbacterium karelineae TaxID=2654283 RepID=UPI0012EA94CF|nr:sulfotransferase [Microbacterium karelineae]